MYFGAGSVSDDADNALSSVLMYFRSGSVSDDADNALSSVLMYSEPEA